MEKLTLLDLKRALEERLEQHLRRVSFPDEKLAKGARVLLSPPGKRIRPLFTLSLGMALGSHLEALLDAAAALEMVHTYSLIHDDLPCMDNDDFRRGEPTLHRVVGESTALLIGDFLLTYAFEILSSASSLDAETRLNLIHTLAKASGAEGMVGGQALDLAKSSNHTECNLKKTGALFRAAFLFSVIICKKEKQWQSDFALLGERVGLLYQLIDDIVDGDEPKEKTREAFLLFEGISKTFSLYIKENATIDPLLASLMKPLSQESFS